jgi:hypothetical protein
MNNYFATNAAADAIAATIPAALIPAYLAVTDAGQKTAILLRASSDIDTNPNKYQGRRFDVLNQLNEFPRWAREPSNHPYFAQFGYITGALPAGIFWGDEVWDVDPNSLLAVVPNDVLVACIYQANFIAKGGSRRLNDQHEGVVDVSTGPLRETYKDGAGLRTGLCRDAYLLIKKYQLSGGRLL